MDYSIRKIDKLQFDKLNIFIDTIYNNFLDLTKIKELNHNKNELMRILSSKHFIGFHMFKNDQVIGYIIGEIIVIEDGRMVAYINYLYVSSKYRKNGFGSSLLSCFINESKKNGVSYIMLTCNKNNKNVLNMYNKHGFNIDTFQRSIDPYVVLVKYINH